MAPPVRWNHVLGGNTCDKVGLEMALKELSLPPHHQVRKGVFSVPSSPHMPEATSHLRPMMLGARLKDFQFKPRSLGRCMGKVRCISADDRILDRDDVMCRFHSFTHFKR